MPFVYKHIAAMPDAHLGIGSTVGSVIATKGAIIPAAVGVDLGCGMLAVKTSLKEGHLDGKLSSLRFEIEKAVPVGRAEFTDNQEWAGFAEQVHAPVKDKLEKARRQLGTLGGGNHFIEICLDSKSDVWLMLHSGSRHIGKVLADWYIEHSKSVAKAVGRALPDQDLAYLLESDPEFVNYINDLDWAQRYAKENREQMMVAVLEAMRDELGKFTLDGPLVNCHHNYVSVEEHFGAEVFVTRKGAISAYPDEWGIIPGSMGARSYIVKGRGCPDSFCSAPHGAGRRMSRGEAKRSFTVEDLEKQTAGVECRKDGGVLDEIPGAYKPIDEVMSNSSDLVDIVHELKQVLCVKG
jgi:tRNA-splicing ligase RtcB